MERVITEEELYDELYGDWGTAFHLEQSRHYQKDLDYLDAWLAGDWTPPPELWPHYAHWCTKVTEAVAAGRRMERVRIFAEPPTTYQQWELWVGRWNVEAGEVIRYMTETKAAEVGVVPGVGPDDFWLLDNERLIVMPWGPNGEQGEFVITTDPERVATVRHWWGLAVTNSSEHDYTVPPAT